MKKVKKLGFVDATYIIRVMRSEYLVGSKLPLGFAVHMFMPAICKLTSTKVYAHVHHDEIGEQLGFEIGFVQSLFGELQNLTIDGNFKICDAVLSSACIELILHTYLQECMVGNQIFPYDVRKFLTTGSANFDVMAYFGSMHLTSTYENFTDKLKILQDESTTVSYFECSVCFKDFSHGFNIYHCGHNFCKECILKMKDVDSTCPLCRSPMKQERVEIDDAKTRHMSNLISLIEVYATKITIEYLKNQDTSNLTETTEQHIMTACCKIQQNHIQTIGGYCQRVLSSVCSI
jgi:hypothetical protein